MLTLLQKLHGCAEHGGLCDARDIECGFQSEVVDVLWFACKLAGISANERWVPALCRCAVMEIEGDNPDVNSIAIWALAKIGGRQVSAFWRSASLSSVARERRAAADLIGEMAEREGITTLATLLRDEDESVSSWAALSLSKLGDISISTLVDYLHTSDSPRRLTLCIDALMKIRPTDGVDFVLSIAKSENESKAELLREVIDHILAYNK